jgi:hypothetical protein
MSKRISGIMSAFDCKTHNVARHCWCCITRVLQHIAGCCMQAAAKVSHELDLGANDGSAIDVKNSACDVPDQVFTKQQRLRK